jgi:hypothetical protein
MRTPPSKPRRLGWIAAVAALLAGLAAWAIWHDAGNERADAARAASASSGATSLPVKRTGALDKPLWSELTPAQQVALGPLHPEWDALDGVRKKKWLELSRRFGSMNPQEQARVHERMRVWMRLTPEQRNLARENYNKARKLAPGDKAATWESYKQLTPDQKEKLAQAAARKKAAAVNSPAAANMIVAPTSCPAGTTRRGASCMSLEPPAAIPTAPALTQPAPAPAAVPPAATPAAPAPAAPAPQPLAAPATSNANG